MGSRVPNNGHGPAELPVQTLKVIRDFRGWCTTPGAPAGASSPSFARTPELTRTPEPRPARDAVTAGERAG